MHREQKPFGSGSIAGVWGRSPHVKIKNILSMSDEEKAAFELAQKKDSRKTADKAQYAKYKSVLGAENVPKTLDAFQNMKYNDGGEYERLKELYRYRSKIKKVDTVSLTEEPFAVTEAKNKKGGISRNYYGDNGRQTKQISNNSHGHKAVENFGKHGEHAHDYE